MAIPESIGSMTVDVRADLSKWNKDMDDLKKDATRNGKEVEKQFNSTVKQGFDGLNVSAKDLIQRIEDLDKRWDKLTATLGKYSATSKQGQIIIRERKAALEQLIAIEETGSQKLDQNVIRSTYALNAMGRVVDSIPRGMRGITSSSITAASSLAIMGVRGNSLKQILSSIGQSLAGGGGIVLALGALSLIVEAVSNAFDEADKSMVEFDLDMVLAKTDAEKWADSLKKVRNELAELSGDELNDKIGRLRKQLKDTAEDIGKSFSLWASVPQLAGFLEQFGIIDNVDELNTKLKETGATLNAAEDTNKGIVDLVKKQEGIVKSIKEEESTTEAQLIDKNKRLKSAEEELNRLKNLGIEKEEKKKNAIDEIIKKIKTENQLAELTNSLTLGVLESGKKTLENTLSLATTDEERVKILTQIRDIEKEIAGLEFFGAGDFIDIEAEMKKFAEETDKDAQKYAEHRMESEQQLQELKLHNIADEFDQREARINAEYDELAFRYRDNAELLAEIEKARELDLYKLQQDRFSASLSTAKDIASALSSIVGSSNEFVNGFLQALQIAESIAALLSSINAFSGFGGFFGLISPAGGALPGSSLGGQGLNLSKGATIPRGNIPEFVANQLRAPSITSNASTFSDPTAHGLLKNIANAVVTSNLFLSRTGNDGQPIAIYIDGKKIFEVNQIRINRAKRMGKNLSEIF